MSANVNFRVIIHADLDAFYSVSREWRRDIGFHHCARFVESQRGALVFGRVSRA